MSESDFDAFVAARGRALWRTAWLLTADRHTAEDLVQSTLVETWRRWDRIGGMEHAEAYVRRVMVTTHLRWWRRRRVPVSFGPVPEVAVVEIPPPSDLLLALRELPAAQRAVIVLRYFDDRTEAQTAELLGVSVGTVKSHHARALARLRTLPQLSSEALS
ncbi:MAG: SigE family RNA polymerase sigma factor [Actinobacteria bacterium]|nr:SigE family RNA polymerase sigma factor [Actinomycetota bacterium]MCA1720081.1 SigE family RNA polymerase sigma factor [Actinomycetota bacterium]